MGDDWVSIPKGFRNEEVRPMNRPLSRLEAFYRLRIDYDEGNDVSISKYCREWHWSWNRAKRFLSSLGVMIDYDGHLRGKLKPVDINTQQQS